MFNQFKMVGLAQYAVSNRATVTSFVAARAGRILGSEIVVELQIQAAPSLLPWRRIRCADFRKKCVEPDVIQKGLQSNGIVCSPRKIVRIFNTSDYCAGI